MQKGSAEYQPIVDRIMVVATDLATGLEGRRSSGFRRKSGDPLQKEEVFTMEKQVLSVNTLLWKSRLLSTCFSKRPCEQLGGGMEP